MIYAPRSVYQLTPAWMTAAVARRHPHAVVDGIELHQVVNGTNTRATARLHYSAGSGPQSVFIKTQGAMPHRLALLALGAFNAEAQLFHSKEVLPLEHARPYAAGVDRLRLRTVAVIEDVTTRQGRPNDATTPLTVAQVRSGLQELASLHATHWDRPLPPHLRFLGPWRLKRRWAPISYANLARGLHRLHAAGLGEIVPANANARLLERQFRASATLAAQPPHTILHGDPHPGNTYVLPTDRRLQVPRLRPGPPRSATHPAQELTGFYDWQLVRTGNAAHDVGYFLVSSLSVADRRAHERHLLEAYLDALARAGAPAPSLQAAIDRYRTTPAYGLCTWLHTFAAGTFQSDAVCLCTIERFAAAYEDLQTITAPALLRFAE